MQHDCDLRDILFLLSGGHRVVFSTATFHARVRGSYPGLGGLKETKMFLPHQLVKLSCVGSLRGREVACSASDRQGLNFESWVWRAVSSHHPQEVLLAQFSLYVHKSGLKPDSFHSVLIEAESEMINPWTLKTLKGLILTIVCNIISRVVLSEAVDGCICFTRKIQHGGDWERSRPHDPKNVHNVLMTVRPLSRACGHETECYWF